MVRHILWFIVSKWRTVWCPYVLISEHVFNFQRCAYRKTYSPLSGVSVIHGCTTAFIEYANKVLQLCVHSSRICMVAWHLLHWTSQIKAQTLLKHLLLFIIITWFGWLANQRSFLRKIRNVLPPSAPFFQLLTPVISLTMIKLILRKHLAVLTSRPLWRLTYTYAIRQQSFILYAQ